MPLAFAVRTEIGSLGGRASSFCSGRFLKAGALYDRQRKGAAADGGRYKPQTKTGDLTRRYSYASASTGSYVEARSAGTIAPNAAPTSASPMELMTHPGVTRIDNEGFVSFKIACVR
jgi:hypothetical protein